ncbi:MAG: iron-containing redox enzyme family protein [Steroidobacteraceae bacterium]|nr:iron-containing redox enzyme family protein [Steroidobacteraceae bacterium]MDW8258522.1 iron-containing redox enzyme family protein [Gammaproteobacteria bacterium]
MMSQQDFFAALEAARQPKHGGGHAFSRAWAAGELSRAQLGAWAVQHFYYIDPVPQQFALLYSRLPDLDARQHLMDNLLGEEMPQAPDKRHPDLLRKFARACGVSDERILYAEQNGDILPTTRAMRAWVWELAGIRHLAEACAGIMVALEGQLPTLYPSYVDAMRRMGFSDDELEFFHVHIAGDTEHAQVGLQLTHRYASSAELQRRAIAAVRASAELRYSMLDGIYERVVLHRAA